MSRYLPRLPDTQATLRLFCFHHAGGSAAAFKGWSDIIGDQVSVVPVQLPGREGRIREPRFTELKPLVNELERELRPWLDLPHAFYGHSMGALLAYTLTRRASRAGSRLPEALIVGGYPAPHLPHALQLPPGLPDEQLVDLLTGLGGLPPAIAHSPEWLDVLLPVIRDDLAVCATHRVAPPEPLDVPVHALAGADDLLVDVADVQAWAEHTTNEFTTETLPGGHFYPRDRPAAFYDALNRTVFGVVDMVNAGASARR
jgi:surfactin synthase thioesterase subunit